MKALITALATVFLVGCVTSDRVEAFDAEQVFAKGAFVLSAEGGYGEQFDLENVKITGLDFYNVGLRFGFLPWGVAGPVPFRGALEIGIEPIYERFVDPVDAFFAGLGAVARYHFVSMGRFVPYIELAAAPGGTDLRVREQDTDIVFLLFGGVGASFFLTDRAALYAGYRLQHISNAGTDSPNQGINSHTGVAGISIFFP